MRKLIAAAALTIAILGTAAPAPAATPDQRVDMRVLLLSKDGNEPTFDAWQHVLGKEGVPYDAVIADRDADITSASLADGATHARYQAVVVAGSVALAGFTSAERAALDHFERTFGIRRVLGYVYPGSQNGLTVPKSSGNAGGTVAQLTAAGRNAFAYLKGAVPIDGGAWGYLGAVPLAGADFTTLVSAPDGSVVVGVHRFDGREELVITVDANKWHSHWQLLAHGMVGWATRGTYLGYERKYLTMHVDDVLLPNDRWDPALNVTTSTKVIRMTDKDVSRAVTWSQNNAFKLDMAFNGQGAAEAGPRDKLTSALLQNKDKFRWINHTWGHLNLNDTDLATLKDQITRNITWARDRNIAIDPTELVTGEHSGLKNPDMPVALTETGIAWIASDNSREPEPYLLGPALTVPRHPTGVYYNVGSKAEQLDEYNWLYFENCQNNSTTTCLAKPATWSEYVDSEARIVLRHVMDNDARSHYAHQSNLAEEGTLYPVLDEVLRRYRERFAAPLVQPTHKQVGQLLQWRAGWDAAVTAGRVSGYLLGGNITIESAGALVAPVTGSDRGAAYDGSRRSDWVPVGAGTTSLPVTATG